MEREQLEAAVAQLRSHHAVVIIGAGLSSPRYPMTPQLGALLWHAFDTNPLARQDLAEAISKKDQPAKLLLGEDRAAVDIAWTRLSSNPEVRRTFQAAFVDLDLEREPTMAHLALASLIQAGIVELVISFNWDTALERAYEQLFGHSLPRDILEKPHGDAAHPNDAWVFPNSGGVIPDALLTQMTDLAAKRPRALVIVGYSGSDPVVVRRLLDPFQSRWPVIRVSPSASGTESISGTADEVFPALAHVLRAGPDLEGWHWVTFQRQRSLTAALMGSRLGPQDVDACPLLPGLRLVAARLRAAQFAEISGDSGSGKSISAFQAARELNRDGWAVVELARPGIADLETVRAFSALPGRVLAVIDDAQALDDEVVFAFERSVSQDHAILLSTTERVVGQEQVHISSRRAVEALALYCRTHLEQIAGLVARLDNRVGHGLAQERIEYRIETAETSDAPWQFMYVLGGGDRRIGDALAAVADDDAELLFGVIAAEQLLSLDAGISRDELGSRLPRLQRNAPWLARSLGVLEQNRLLSIREGQHRTPHLRIADRGLLSICADPRSSLAVDLLSYMRSRLLDPEVPLQGKLWLIRCLDRLDALRLRNRSLILTEEIVSLLIDRSLSAARGSDRGIAAYLLWELGWWQAMRQEQADQVGDALRSWIEECTSEEVWGIRWLLGGLRSNFEVTHARICQTVRPEILATRLSAFGTVSSADDWAHVVREIAQAKEVDRTEWGRRLDVAVDSNELESWTAKATPDESVRGLVELASTLAFIAPNSAIATITAITPAVVGRLEVDPYAASQDLLPWAFGLFLALIPDAEPEWSDKTTYARLRAALSDLIGATDWTQVGKAVTQVRLHESHDLNLLTFSLAAFAPHALDRMLASIDISELEKLTSGHWETFDATEPLLVSLGYSATHEPSASLIRKHEHEITALPTRLVPVVPDVAARLVRNGRIVQLSIDWRWDWGTEAIDALATLDSEAARMLLRAHGRSITEGLALTPTRSPSSLIEFINASDSVDPSVIDDALQAIDPELADANWRTCLSRTDEVSTAAREIVRRAARLSGPIGMLARNLTISGDGTDG